jgi:predicted ester cyclase
VFNTGALDRMDEFAVPHIAAGGKRYVAERRRLFTDLVYTIDEQVAEADTVVTRFTQRGTNLGPIGDHPPTGRRIEASGVFFWRLVDGKVVELCSLIDHERVHEQLGIAPGRP